ncbi:MAG TPA: nuclear transport factor 2 family protein [Acidimicrobiales bacterium]|jgi:ketosteroid isomerase-like protein|nr:nuclear transport factor 2 family protein [Acidimicrobiales bacterium]
MPETEEAERLAARVRRALESGDPAAYGELLDPKVTWGAPGYAPTCRNRDQVLAWYRRGRDSGARATVDEVTIAAGCLLVGLTVTGRDPDAPGAQERRWQVLTTKDGRITDIVGYDNRPQAAARAGLG